MERISLPMMGVGHQGRTTKKVDKGGASMMQCRCEMANRCETIPSTRIKETEKRTRVPANSGRAE